MLHSEESDTFGLGRFFEESCKRHPDNIDGSFSDFIQRMQSLSDAAHSAPNELVYEIVNRCCAGAVNWASADICCNVGTAPNKSAVQGYAAGLSANLYILNDQHAANAIHAEMAVVKAIGQLFSCDTSGFFVFGGTATNFYALHLGLTKSIKNFARKGCQQEVRVISFAEGHFSIPAALKWSGIGEDSLLIIPKDRHGETDFALLRSSLTDCLRRGIVVPIIYLNGGSTYYHTVDSCIRQVAELLDELVERFRLDYRPHLHVDSVIGWMWGVFNQYDFSLNSLNIPSDVLGKLRRQTDKIKDIYYADSWGVDLHKGIGGCPCDCSLFMINDKKDLAWLGGKETHQFANEFYSVSPIDYTLEGSRGGGKVLAALSSLHSMGLNMMRLKLANLVGAKLRLEARVNQCADMFSLSNHAAGFVLMVRVIPAELAQLGNDVTLFNETLFADINEYNKAFYSWCKEKFCNGFKYEFSFCSSPLFNTAGEALHSLKFYFHSPETQISDGDKWFIILRDLKDDFDRSVIV